MPKIVVTVLFFFKEAFYLKFPQTWKIREKYTMFKKLSSQNFQKCEGPDECDASKL